MADIKKIKIGNTEYNIKDSISGYIKLTSLSGTSPISYNNSTGAISVASGYQIPTTTQVSQIGTNTSDISTINGKIPSQASTTNQLADKSFVNSSISTNTANFIGTFNSVADLEAYSGTLTNNDYAFVVETDQQGNTVYNRYKYTTATNPPEWVFEYALNNSSFTANQWASINSGATTTNIGLAESALQSGDDISELNNDAGYITTSALNGYATQTWVGQQGYITGITSSDVTTALGYTPYNSSNPNGYTSNVGTVTSVNNVQPVNGNVTLSIPTQVTESTVSGWGFTKNTGTVTSVNNVSPTNGNVTLSIPTQASDIGAQPTLVSGTNIKTINGNSLLGSGNLTIDGLPNQTGNAGKFLTTDGTDAGWASIPSDSTKANTDLSNLTSTGKNIGNWSSNVSNCITYIPQDIKLGLNNGTLTLKAGSKCYVKGDTTSPTFTITSDKTATQTINGNYFAFYDGTNLVTYSKSTYDYSTLPSTTSFPLAEITVSGGAISRIEQVFNGFGYIGSTVFALPGVKGLIPNGRNEDGSLKNIEFTTNSVLTVNVSGSVNNYSIVLNGSALYALGVYQEVDKPVSGYVNYIESENYNYNGLNKRSWTFVGSYNTSSGKITSLTPKTVFHALDYNNKGTIAGWAMPSSRYTDLTLLASGSTYTAPANGWFYFAKTASASNQYMTIYINNGETPIFATTMTQALNGGQARCFLPVKKGDVVGVNYDLGGQTRRFCFVYAEGEPNV